MSGLPASDPLERSGRSTSSATRQILIPDACVGVKWYIPELESSEAARLLDPQFELHVPAYFFTEAASVFQDARLPSTARSPRPRGWMRFCFSRPSQ